MLLFLRRSGDDQVFLQKVDEKKRGPKRISKRQLGMIMTHRVTRHPLYLSRVIIGTRNPNNKSSLAPIFKTIRSVRERGTNYI